MICFTKSLLYKYLTLVNCTLEPPSLYCIEDMFSLVWMKGRLFFFFFADMRERMARGIQKRPQEEIKYILNMDTILDLAM